MDTRSLGDLLRKAERLFRRAGAAQQADALRSVSQVVAEQPNQTVTEYTARATSALKAPTLYELSPEEIALRLRNLRRDREEFNRIFSILSDTSFPTEKLVAAARAFTGTPMKRASRPSALKAIKSFFEDRVQLSVTADMAR